MPSRISNNIAYTCACDSPYSGQVLLFYRYYRNSPSTTPTDPSTTASLATFHRDLTRTLHITGKIRIASEGFNVTAAGSTFAIDSYIEACLLHPSFHGLKLSTPELRKGFFKPTPGCACVFQRQEGGGANVRICDEITPLGVTGYAPRQESWACVRELKPSEFHAEAGRAGVGSGTMLLDLRNHYESRVGYFVGGSGSTDEAVVAMRPQIRRFSQFPLWFRRRWTYVIEARPDVNGTLVMGSTRSAAGVEVESIETQSPKQVLTYCTGGIRCEKATRWMAEQQQQQKQYFAVIRQPQICTLQGGIQAYLDWVGDEVDAGRMKREDSLFKGRNYVFDARGTTGRDNKDIVSNCHHCGKSSSCLGKCMNARCHLDLVVCEDCAEIAYVVCCKTCKDVNGEKVGLSATSQRMCECESERERLLWGDSINKIDGKTNGRRAVKR